MKPLELTIFPKSRGWFGPQYDMPDGRPMLAREGADVMSRRKRLTDAELAAEVYREMALEFESLAGYAYAKAEGDVMAQILHEATNVEHRRRGRVLYRFATLPHYDEVDA